jgi:hypothetical protein
MIEMSTGKTRSGRLAALRVLLVVLAIQGGTPDPADLASANLVRLLGAADTCGLIPMDGVGRGPGGAAAAGRRASRGGTISSRKGAASALEVCDLRSLDCRVVRVLPARAVHREDAAAGVRGFSGCGPMGSRGLCGPVHVVRTTRQVPLPCRLIC